ncbi:toxin-antitoxin system, toxin component [Streptomyces sp. NPDC002640]
MTADYRSRLGMRRRSGWLWGRLVEPKSAKSRTQEMGRLSAALIRSMRRAGPVSDDIFDTLAVVLSQIRERPVMLRRADFPPETVSGLWLNLADMDVVAVRRDAAGCEHEDVILGHEIWHMLQGHQGVQTQPGQQASARSGAQQAVCAAVVALQLPSPGREASSVAARTQFHLREEAEAEAFGLRFATDLRLFRMQQQRPGNDVAWRIEDSVGPGSWT